MFLGLNCEGSPLLWQTAGPAILNCVGSIIRAASVAVKEKISADVP